MSVSNEVTRIQAARNAIRNTLLAWGVAQADDSIDELAAALAALPNRGAVEEALEEGQTYTIPQGYHNGSGSVTNVVRAGRLEPSVYDYNSGYVSNGSWIYENPTNTYVDIYRVEAGCSYFITLGGTVGTRFRVMFTTEDVTQATGTVVGTSIKNLNNPAPFTNAAYTADEDGYIIVAKDNIGASGLGSYVYNRTEKWT
jgi:hypothetical protein